MRSPVLAEIALLEKFISDCDELLSVSFLESQSIADVQALTIVVEYDAVQMIYAGV